MGRGRRARRVGFRPTRPQNAAGMRIDPPPSVPVASGAMPAASAAPLPPLEPPGDQSRAHGSRVSPNSRFDVNPSKANSGRFVLPTTTAPAARRRATASQSRTAGEACSRSSDPNVVGSPATSSLSLTSKGRPASGPGSSPASMRASTAAASAKAPSPRVLTTALIGPSSRSMRSSDSATSPSADTTRALDGRGELMERHEAQATVDEARQQRGHAGPERAGRLARHGCRRGGDRRRIRGPGGRARPARRRTQRRGARGARPTRRTHLVPGDPRHRGDGRVRRYVVLPRGPHGARR